MYLLIAYDVSTIDQAGRRRLRRIAKTCLDYGQRVQNSVFECLCDPSQFVEFKGKLLSIMDSEYDSVRIYHLGKNWERKVEHYGKNDDYNINKPLIL
ncbi:MAG: CRISPR-associated endonuclease Cas2 [Verrucomicrobiae bacterium]|nr:CRISPR-associated endonuclease Cas2 [Verrucomicrobiae bacterium]NNJ41773.1 CRISPR-associated endonuclease Cas2 [Akkermansiaceae bacterium]